VPELPEVETIVRGLRPRVEGRLIVRADYFAPRAALGRPDEMAARLTGRRILSLQRHGKHLLLELDQGWVDIHLRMTGKLLLTASRDAYRRARLTLDDAQLDFEDVRQFGYLVWRPNRPDLGPDALSLTEDALRGLLAPHRGALKPLLLDQSAVAGLGNIYVDEALFRARLHPRTSAARLGPERRGRLLAAVREVLSEAIALGGSSISDYVDAEGRAGSFQSRHRVYGRTGQPCPVCGAAIQRLVVSQRGTHLCPRCQRP
jgi:formamidopyrimidine-DNA glycosylase